MSSPSPPSTSNTAAPGRVPLVTVAPTSYRRSLSRRRESSPLLPPQLGGLCSLGSCSAHWGGGGTEAKRSPWAAKRDPPRAAACREQALAADAGGAVLHFSNSPERKQSTSAGRKGSKGVTYTSCFLPLHCLQYLPRPRDRGLHAGCSCWVVPAPEGAVAKEQTSSSLPVLPQLPQHPLVLAVGSGSSAPTGLQATEASPFPTDTSAPAPSAKGPEDAPTPPSPRGSEHRDLVPAHRVQVIIQGQQDQKGEEQSSCREEVPDIMVIKEA